MAMHKPSELHAGSTCLVNQPTVPVSRGEPKEGGGLGCNFFACNSGHYIQRPVQIHASSYIITLQFILNIHTFINLTKHC